MSATLDYNGLVGVLRAAAEKVISGVDVLTRLDSTVGDGDHGIAMKNAMQALEQGLDRGGDGNKALLNSVAMSVMSINAGSTGPLMGSLFMGMAGAVGDAPEMDCAMLAGMFQAGLNQLQTITTAKIGDKTMMDALIPAVAAINNAAQAGADVAAALAKAADAAQAGAESTRDMQAKFGKARNIGERSLGHKDPGATSMSMIFRGMAEGAAALAQ
jgi:dihydroxyacetone kinase-like protein